MAALALDAFSFILGQIAEYHGDALLLASGTTFETLCAMDDRAHAGMKGNGPAGPFPSIFPIQNIPAAPPFFQLRRNSQSMNFGASPPRPRSRSAPVAVIHHKISFFHAQDVSLVDQKAPVAAQKAFACDLLLQRVHAARGLDYAPGGVDKRDGVPPDLYV